MARVIRPKFLIPLAAVILFLLGGWTLRNKLAADRQGEWVRATRGDLVTGFEVTGALASLSSESLGPPPLPDIWDFKISMLAPEGADVKKGQPVLGFDTTELQRRLEEKTAEADRGAQADREGAQRSWAAVEGRAPEAGGGGGAAAQSALKLDTPADIVGINERKTAEIEHQASPQRETASATGPPERARKRGPRADRPAGEQAAAGRGDRRADAERDHSDDRARAPRDGTVVYIDELARREEEDRRQRLEGRARGRDPRPGAHEGRRRGRRAVDAGRVAVGQRVTLRLDAHPDDELHGTITMPPARCSASAPRRTR